MWLVLANKCMHANVSAQTKPADTHILQFHINGINRQDRDICATPGSKGAKRLAASNGGRSRRCDALDDVEKGHAQVEELRHDGGEIVGGTVVIVLVGEKQAENSCSESRLHGRRSCSAKRHCCLG